MCVCVCVCACARAEQTYELVVVMCGELVGAWADGWVHGRINGWMDGWMGGRANGWWVAGFVGGGGYVGA